MQFPYQTNFVATPQNTIAITALVPDVINAINANKVLPYGDYNGPNIYYFTTSSSNLGNIIYTVFDKETTLGLASYSVRYGAGTNVYQIIFGVFPKSQIKLQYLVLPKIPNCPQFNGTVIP